MYSKGEFELALVFYHRGHKLRPELQEFTLGINKAQEAIDNSVGSKDIHTCYEDFNLTAKAHLCSDFFGCFCCVMYLISSGPDRVKLTKEGDLSFFNKIEEVSYKGLLASLCLLNVPIREY